jgi:hypothetical protein
MSDYYVGVDLGQAADYTAISILERADAGYHLVHLERPARGTPYPVIVARVATLLQTEPLAGPAPSAPPGPGRDWGTGRGNATLVVDATGVGAAVTDLLEHAGLKPIAVTITGGDVVSRDGRRYRVPKRDLVSTLQVLLQSGRLRVASDLALAETLVSELVNFRYTLSPLGHDSYGAWRENQHDDLVLAVALATWYAERRRGDDRLVAPVVVPGQSRWAELTGERFVMPAPNIWNIGPSGPERGNR